MNAECRNQRVAHRSRRPSGWTFRFGHLGFCFLLCYSAFRIPHSAFAAPTTGARIDESKVVKTYYVDPAGANAADDNEHGTQDSPFLTLKHALAAAIRDKDANAGARVIIAPGTYRESIDIPAPANKAADTDAPLVIEAAERGQTIIDAADAAGWEVGTWKAEGKEWTHPWPFRWNDAKVPRADPHETFSYRPELVFADGNALRQVEAVSSLVPGTFWISPGTARQSRGNVTVHVMLPEEADPAAAVYQIGVRDHALSVTGRHNVVVRGLLIQHATNPAGAHGIGEPSAGLVFKDCSDVLVEDVLSQWNGGAGLMVSGRTSSPWNAGITLRRVQLIHNGGSGLIAASLKNFLAEDCETSFNNFRCEWAVFADPQGSAGIIAHGIHGSAWRRQRAVANFCRGLVWSGDCTDLLVEDAVVHDNLFSGLYLENCPGPSLVRGCLVTGNRMLATSKPEASQPAGVSFEASPDVTLENNVIAGNLMPQLGLRDVSERTDGTDFETGARTTLRAERHIYRHNAFYGADASQILINLPVADRAGKGDFAFYYATLDSDENCFWNPASPEVFCTYDRTAYRRPGMALAGWKTLLSAHANAGNGGQGDRRPEAGSLWDDPRFMEPAEGDYRLQAQSPLTDWGLPSEEGGAAQ